MEKQELNTMMLEKFRDAWSKYDPDATGFLKIEDFADVMFELGKPLGWDESYRNKVTK